MKSTAVLPRYSTPFLTSMTSDKTGLWVYRADAIKVVRAEQAKLADLKRRISELEAIISAPKRAGED